MKTIIELIDLQGTNNGNKTIVLEGELVVTYNEIYDVDQDGERELIMFLDLDNRIEGIWRDIPNEMLWTDFNVIFR